MRGCDHPRCSGCAELTLALALAPTLAPTLTPQVLDMLANAFGTTMTETGHKLLPPYIRVIQVS